MPTHAQATFVQTPYPNPKALVDVYLDHPAKMGRRCIGCARWQTRWWSQPYSMLPEDMSVIVLLHGTELVADDIR